MVHLFSYGAWGRVGDMKVSRRLVSHQQCALHPHSTHTSISTTSCMNYLLEEFAGGSQASSATPQGLTPSGFVPPIATTELGCRVTSQRESVAIPGIRGFRRAWPCSVCLGQARHVSTQKHCSPSSSFFVPGGIHCHTGQAG